MSIPDWSSENLHIVFVSYGGTDYTDFVTRQFSTFTQTGGNTKFTFTVGKDFFGEEPNPGVTKVCVVVVRYRQTADSGATLWTSLFPTVHHEKDVVSIGGDPHIPFTSYSSEMPDQALKKFVASAFWYDQDVTAKAQEQIRSQTPNANNAYTISVSESSLGIKDPVFGTNKSCAVVYAIFINGQWLYRGPVDLQQPEQWNLLPQYHVVQTARRLNIYSATWGGQDVTAWVRQQY